MPEVNYLAVLVSVVASMVIGSIWYGPLFGKMFMEACGMDKWTPEEKAAAQKKMGMSYVLQTVASIVMFYVLARFITDLDQMTLWGGVVTALWVWVGFVVPVKIADAIWGGNKTLSWLSVGNFLVTLLATGAIIGVWR